MTPTLIGRIQTRIVLLATVGFGWTILVSPFLFRFGASFGAVLGGAVLALWVVGFFGIGWELVYHAMQQYRWEKDWPTLFGLITAANEGFVAFLALWVLLPSGPHPVTFFLHFSSTWIMIWLVANGPMRVILPRWRFRGGRIL